MGMRPENDLDAAQCAMWWVQKFAFLLTFKAFQEEEAIDSIQNKRGDPSILKGWNNHKGMTF